MEQRNDDGPSRALPRCPTRHARVHSAQQLGDNIVLLSMKLSHGSTVRFLAGQSVRIQLPDGSAHTLAVANAPGRTGVASIDVHLGIRERSMPHRQAGEPPRVVLVPPVQAEVQIDGPFGDFYWRDEGNQPVVLIASDAEFAPLKSMVEHALGQHDQRPLHIYWGVGTQDELYLHGLVQSWVENNDHIYYTPVLRAPRPASSWHGRTGDACDALIEDLPDLSPYRIYLSADSRGGDVLRQRLIGDAHADPDELFISWRHSTTQTNKGSFK